MEFSNFVQRDTSMLVDRGSSVMIDHANTIPLEVTLPQAPVTSRIPLLTDAGVSVTAAAYKTPLPAQPVIVPRLPHPTKKLGQPGL